jgi:hypothetical protein
MKKSKQSAVRRRKNKQRLFTPQGPIGRFFDQLMRPIMVWLQDYKFEEPQRTHFWNWTKIQKCLAYWLLDKKKMATVVADPAACRSHWLGIPRHHLTRFGGWRKYVVLTPSLNDWAEGDVWYVGWVDEAGICCVSLVPLITSVRMLRGDKKARFLAFNCRQQQIVVYASDYGEIGMARPEHAKLPLL